MAIFPSEEPPVDPVQAEHDDEIESLEARSTSTHSS